MQIWQLWAFAAAGFAALTALLTKVGVQGVDTVLATLIRLAVVLPVFALLVVARGQAGWLDLRSLSGLSLIALALSGVATGLSWFCYNRALQLGPVSGVAALDKVSVVLVAVLAWLILGEQAGVRLWIGVVLMALGATLVAWT